jgi:hypothetical protein
MVFSPKRAAAAAAAAAGSPSTGSVSFASSSASPPHYRHRSTAVTPFASSSISNASKSPSFSSPSPSAASAPPPRRLSLCHALACARGLLASPSRRAAVFSAIDVVFICLLLCALRFLWHVLYTVPHFRIDGAVDPMRLQLWSRVHPTLWHDRTRPLVDLIVRPSGAPQRVIILPAIRSSNQCLLISSWIGVSLWPFTAIVRLCSSRALLS